MVGVLATAAKLAGAAKVMVTARYFGAGDQLDAFVIAFLLPAFFTDIVAGSFCASFIPGVYPRAVRPGRRRGAHVRSNGSGSGSGRDAGG